MWEIVQRDPEAPGARQRSGTAFRRPRKRSDGTKSPGESFRAAETEQGEMLHQLVREAVRGNGWGCLALGSEPCRAIGRVTHYGAPQGDVVNTEPCNVPGLFGGGFNLYPHPNPLPLGEEDSETPSVAGGKPGR